MKNPFLSIENYRSTYTKELSENSLLEYFDSLTTNPYPGISYLMIKFADSEHVPGEEWPGNYGIFSITDYTKYKSPKGRKKIDISPNECIYIDSPDMNEWVSYPLQTTSELIESEKKYQKYSIYNIPHRFREELSSRLIITINGEKSQGSTLTEEMLQDVLSKMSPSEKSLYYRKINKVDIDLYPSVEMPIIIRIDGIDDGAIESQFESLEKVNEFISRISMFKSAYHSILENYGFKPTD
jgi:hypothetical protein